MIYITDKILFYEKNYLYDSKGNQLEIPLEKLSDYNQTIVLVSDALVPKSLKINQSSYSIFMEKLKYRNFHLLSDRLLGLMRCVEYFGGQYAIKRSLHSKDFMAWEALSYYFGDGIRDGHIASQDLARVVEKFSKVEPDVSRCYLVFSSLLYINELIFDELFHAESRLIECINHQIDNFNDFNISEGEYARYSLHSDNAAWCIQDAIKSLASSLDGITKLAYFLLDCDNIPKKTPVKYFSDLSECIKKYEEWPQKKEVLEIIDKLKILTLLRNEITHNRSLNSTRFPIFVGKETDAINNLPLIYSDIIFWDHDGEYFERACNRVGFYTKKLNALSEVRILFEETVKLISLISEHLADKIRYNLLQQKISKVLIYNVDNRELMPIDLNHLECKI